MWRVGLQLYCLKMSGSLILKEIYYVKPRVYINKLLSNSLNVSFNVSSYYINLKIKNM